MQYLQSQKCCVYENSLTFWANECICSLFDNESGGLIVEGRLKAVGCSLVPPKVKHAYRQL